VEQRRAKMAPAVSNDAVAAAAERRAVNNGIPFPGGPQPYRESFV
jgi:hypothetical protein